MRHRRRGARGALLWAAARLARRRRRGAPVLATGKEKVAAYCRSSRRPPEDMPLTASGLTHGLLPSPQWPTATKGRADDG